MTGDEIVREKRTGNPLIEFPPALFAWPLPGIVHLLSRLSGAVSAHIACRFPGVITRRRSHISREIGTHLSSGRSPTLLPQTGGQHLVLMRTIIYDNLRVNNASTCFME